MGTSRGTKLVKFHQNRDSTASVTGAQVVRLAAAISTALIWIGTVPATASTCDAEPARERIQTASLNYQRVPFGASRIDPTDTRYAWTSLWGEIRLYDGALVSSIDPALYQITRYTPAYSTGLTHSGRYLVFEPASYADRTIVDIRLAAAPELGGQRPGGSVLMQTRPGIGPFITGYRFQMAEPFGGRDTSLGLWRRTRSSGARTLLVLFTRRSELPGGYETRIVGRSDLAFALISQADTTHGGIWSFTLFTEATCPNAIAMLSYTWALYIPQIGRR